MNLRDLGGDEGFELLPVYLAVSLVIHMLIFFLLPYPLKVEVTKRIPVVFMERTTLKIVPRKELEEREFMKGIQDMERFSREKEMAVFSSSKSVPPPISLPPSVSSEAKEFLRAAMLETVKAESKVTSPVEVVPPEKIELNPERIPIYVPKEVTNWRGQEAKKNVPVRKGPLEFTGPVTKRRLIFLPPLPKVAVRENTIVYLKFWVGADGSVSMVRLVRIDGDPALGSVAFRYVKGLRFNSVPESAGSVWGNVKVRFEASR